MFLTIFLFWNCLTKTKEGYSPLGLPVRFKDWQNVGNGSNEMNFKYGQKHLRYLLNALLGGRGGVSSEGTWGCMLTEVFLSQ